MARRIRQYFLHVDTGGGYRTPADFSRAAVEVVWIVRFFYLFVLYSMFQEFFPRIPRAVYGEGGGSSTSWDPLWPVSVLEKLGLEWLINKDIILGVGCIIGLLAVISPGMLIWRLGVFLCIFLFTAMYNSYGSISHGYHLYVYISFALLFLPAATGRPGMSRKDAMACNSAFWLAQCMALLAYSLSGFWKVWVNGLDILATDNFVMILLGRAMEDTKPLPLLVPFFVSHPYLAWVCFTGFVYVETVALFALFRPHLQRPFGLVLIVFHFGCWWLLGFSTIPNIVFWALLLVLSPFAPRRFSLSATLRSLPLLGIPFRIWAAARLSRRERRKPGGLV